jgi:antitoxin CptB
MRMTETTEDRKKRLFYQSHHRGQVENDLLLGRFARQHLAGLDGAALDDYERLLGEADVDIWAWVTGMQHLPARHDNEVFALLRAEAQGKA